MHGKKFFLITFAFLIGASLATFLVLNIGNVTHSIKMGDEIVIKFNKEIKLTSGISILPFAKAEVKTKGFLGVKEIKIIPTEELPKGESLDISFQYKKLFSNEISSFNDSVSVPISEDIKSFSINEVNNLVSINPKIVLEVGGELDHDYNLKILEYPISWKKEILDNKIEFSSTESLPLGLEFTLLLQDKDQVLYQKKFTTTDQPRIIERTEKDYFVPGDVVDIYFSKPMNMDDDVLSIHAPGNGKWMTETYYSFTLGDISPDGKYLFELKSGAKAKDGGVVIDAESFLVNAPGEVEATVTRLEDESQIKVEFNQPIDQKDVEFRFLTVPKIKGTFSWQDNTMFFNIGDLAYETTYNITIPREIKPLYGVPNKKSINISFTTEPMPFKNDIPLVQSKYAKGGSLASVVNVLAFFKIKSTEETILQKMGQDTSLRTENVWGDPRKVFVGSYDNSSGYGVHASVLARVLTSYKRSVTLLTNPSVSIIAKEVMAGKVVIITTADGSDSWQTKEGTTIKAGKNLKVQIVSGVYGKSRLIGFYLHDSQTGEKYKYITVTTMASLLKTVSGVTDQVIVVK